MPAGGSGTMGPMRPTLTSLAAALALLTLPGCGGPPEPTEEEIATEEQARLEEIAEAMGYDSVEEYLAATEQQAQANPLISQVEAAWEQAYADLDNWPLEAFTADNGDRNVTVVSTLAAKPENESRAMELCRAVASLATGNSITAPWDGVIVTAGHRGAFLAECDPIN